MSQWETVMGYGGHDDQFGEIGADEELLDALSISGAGNTEIVGSGGYEIIGARRAAAAQNQAKQIAMKHAIAVRQQALSKRRRFPLGFVPTAVAGGGATTAVIPAAPQNLFRAERVTVPSDIAFDFGVIDIKVGNSSQLVSGGEVPAAIFTEVAIDNEVTFDTAEVGNQITITVRNTNAGALTFRGALMGTIAKT